MKERFPASDPEIIKESPRSEAARKRWEKERQKKSLQRIEMSQTPPMKSWVYHTEWVALMATLITCFVFCFRESHRTNDRLDTHMNAINRRADELHKEFYDLLKETRRPPETHNASYVYTVEQKT